MPIFLSFPALPRPLNITLANFNPTSNGVSSVWSLFQLETSSSVKTECLKLLSSHLFFCPLFLFDLSFLYLDFVFLHTFDLLPPLHPVHFLGILSHLPTSLALTESMQSSSSYLLAFSNVGPLSVPLFLQNSFGPVLPPQCYLLFPSGLQNPELNCACHPHCIKSASG